MTAFMGPGTLLNHFKLIPPKSSTMFQFIVQLIIFSIGILIVICTGYKVQNRTWNFDTFFILIAKPEMNCLSVSVFTNLNKRHNRKQKQQIVFGFLLTSLIPMIDIWPGLYLWFSYGAYNRLAWINSSR